MGPCWSWTGITARQSWRCSVWTAARAVRRGQHVPGRAVEVREEFFGTRRRARPYQSVFHGDRELVIGRRRDMHERIQLLDRRDLEGARVLDLGCNIGSSCFAAVSAGARSAVGVEGSWRIASAAVRLNAYFAAPVSFLYHDLNTRLPHVPAADTVFCFSLLQHLQTATAVADAIDRCGASVLYFEGHAGTSLASYEEILNRDRCAATDLVGYMSDGSHTSRRTRPLYRCELRVR